MAERILQSLGIFQVKQPFNVLGTAGFLDLRPSIGHYLVVAWLVLWYCSVVTGGCCLAGWWIMHTVAASQHGGGGRRVLRRGGGECWHSRSRRCPYHVLLMKKGWEGKNQSHKAKNKEEVMIMMIWDDTTTSTSKSKSGRATKQNTTMETGANQCQHSVTQRFSLEKILFLYAFTFTCYTEFSLLWWVSPFSCVFCFF